jgi:hypothetical protein
MALETAAAMKLPGIAGSDAKDSLDELGYAATLFKKPIASQADLVKAILAGEMWPVQMGELPRLTRPGEAKAAEAKAKKNNKVRRRWRH